MSALAGADLTTVSVRNLARAVRSGEVGAEEVLDEFLARVDELNPALNAIVIDAREAAREDARALDERRWRDGGHLPLAGVPFTLKEPIAAAGLPGCEASSLRPVVVAREDAPLLSRLRAAGAILMGKANASELCLHPDTVNDVYGATRNPHDPSRSAGGSSGGDGAAVGARLCAFGIGADYGGSIRAPAHFCGVSGIRPGLDRVPTTGHLPPVQRPFRGRLSTIGPLAVGADDLELVLSVLADEPIGFALPPRIGIFQDALERPVSRDCLAAVERAAVALDLPVDDVTPPFQLDAERLFDAISGGETRAIVEEAGPLADASPQLQAIGAIVADAPPVPVDAAERLQALEAAAAPWLDEHPVLLAPAAAEPAFELGSLREDVYDLFQHCKLASTLGLPAAVVPAGTTADGLPVGVQVIGRRGREDEVLGVARAISAAVV